MITDKYNAYSESQDLGSQAVGTASSNTVDLKQAGDPGEPLMLSILVEEAFASAGAATVQLKLVTDDNSSFSSATTLWDSGAIGKATLALGYRINVYVPRGMERYSKVTYTVAVADLTAGIVSARLVESADT